MKKLTIVLAMAVMVATVVAVAPIAYHVSQTSQTSQTSQKPIGPKARIFGPIPPEKREHLDEYINGMNDKKCRSVEQARQSWESLKDGDLVEFFE